jgi:tRNA-2-methylthio-N6-dimethylallyladenosine synthase
MRLDYSGKKNGMKYHIITLGCQMNSSDSERVQTVIESLGFSATDNENEADLIGIIACSVRQKAIDKVYSRVYKWNKWKNKRNLLTFVSGCILPADKEKFLKLFDFVFHTNELNLFPEMLKNYGIVTPLHVQETKARPHVDIDLFWLIKPNYQNKFEAYIPIQNGCDKFCTYCAVPYTRGREVSRSSDDILKELERLVNLNYKSITLLGQNVNSYGLDKKGSEISFAQLLAQIGEFGFKSGKEFWVYFTSPHPRDMGEDVIQTIAKYKHLGKQIHLPVQSGDDKVLIRMNRQHGMSEYRKIVDSIRKHLPDATLFTDIIVGFTGETEEQFENTRKAMHEFRYNMAYIAMYSPRPGAASSRWDDDIPLDIKKERFHALSEDLRLETSAYNKTMIGKIYRLLVRDTDRKMGYLSGQTEGKITVRFKSDDLALIGQFVNVKITSAADFSVQGDLIQVLETKVVENV